MRWLRHMHRARHLQQLHAAYTAVDNILYGMECTP